MSTPLFTPSPTVVSFWLPCIPPKATHHRKKIVRLRSKHGQEFSKLADTTALTDAKVFLETLLIPHQIAQPVPAPVELSLEFTFPFRKSEPKRNLLKHRIPHTSKLDCSNLAKTFEDRLVSMWFIEDDGQVARLHVSKWWGDQPGIAVKIWTMVE